MNARSRVFSYETGVLFLLCLTFGFVFFDRNAAGYLSPFIAAELKLNNTQIGLLGSALSVTWALSAYFFGAWSDRLGIRKPFLLVSVLSFSLCSFLSGIAQSFGVLLASRLLMGLAEGPFLPVAMTILMAVSSEERRGFNMGVMQNFFSNLLGSFAAPLILVAIAEHYNWRLVLLHRRHSGPHLRASDCEVRSRTTARPRRTQCGECVGIAHGDDPDCCAYATCGCAC